MPVCPLRRADVIERSLEDEAVLYDSAGSVMHTLNVTAAAIWRMCNGKHTPEDMARKFSQQHEIDVERALQDVLTTLGNSARRISSKRPKGEKVGAGAEGA